VSERRALSPRPRPVARHGRQHRGGIARAIVGLIASAIAVVLIAGVSVAAIAVGQLNTSVQANTVHLSHLNGAQAPPSVDAIKGGVNMLIVGTDTRTGQAGYQTKAELAGSSGAGNNDVTILVHIAEDHQSALVVSFPRDLMIPIPACPNPNGGNYGASSIAMLNSTLSRGGLACPVLTIEKLTGIEIPYAASISFNGVAEMADAVGGVTVCVARPILDPYVNLDLPAGDNTISGQTALAFLRSRHGVGDGSDLGRISNQQVYLSALARTVKSNGVLTNPLKLYGLARAATSSMQLSDSLSHPDTMVAIALALKSIPLSNIAMIQYPVGSSPLYPNRVVPSDYADNAVKQALQNDQRVTLTGTTGRGATLAPGQTATPDPNATATTPATSSTTAPDPNATDPATPVELPSTVQGQSADQQTCSKGNVLHGPVPGG
jgi:LCP family protein required for cell wall assembly